MQVIRSREEFDVCVVGTGAGGGVMIDVLTAAGLDVVALQRGAFLQTTDFHDDAMKHSVRGSSFAAQDFASTVFVARARRDVGRSFIGVLMTDREGRESASYNRVLGPDFQWRPTATDTLPA